GLCALCVLTATEPAALLTLSLHDALPICPVAGLPSALWRRWPLPVRPRQRRRCLLRAGGGALPQLSAGPAGAGGGLCRHRLPVAGLPARVPGGAAGNGDPLK